MPKSVAKVNKETNIVENIIMIEGDESIEGYYLIDIPKNYKLMNGYHTAVHHININETKWFPDKGFIDLEGNPAISFVRAR